MDCFPTRGAAAAGFAPESAAKQRAQGFGPMTLLEKDHREELWERCFGELLDSTQARLQEAGCTRMSKMDALAGHLPQAELFEVYCEATSTSLATMEEEDYDVFRSWVLLAHRETNSLREPGARHTRKTSGGGRTTKVGSLAADASSLLPDALNSNSSKPNSSSPNDLWRP